MTRRTWQRTRPTLGQVQAAIAWQAPPKDGMGLPRADEGASEVRRERNCIECGKPLALGHHPACSLRRRDDLVHLTAEDRAALDQFAPSKPVPRETVPTEQAEHRNLAAWIRLQWWAKGARRLESQASRGLKERGQLKEEGGEFLAGNPDWMVFVPERWRWVRIGGDWGQDVKDHHDPMTLAVELKRRDAGKTRPRDREWWLTDRWPWQERGEVENPDGQLYGLRYSQRCVLKSMALAGVRTYVAYGWDDAAQWLEAQIGPRPAVEPDWGW